MSNQCDLEKQLDSFDPQERRQALEGLAALKLPPAKPTDNHNLHFHSFFSYNAQDWSPSHIAWAAHQAGLYAAGLCDFDVLDGLEEFYAASALLGLRATVNLETRVYLREHSEVEITSPGEPGVTYIMGVPGADDVMLGYQSTSFHDSHYLRQVLGLKPAPEFEAWLEKMRIVSGGQRLLPVGEHHALIDHVLA